ASPPLESSSSPHAAMISVNATSGATKCRIRMGCLLCTVARRPARLDRLPGPRSCCRVHSCAPVDAGSVVRVEEVQSRGVDCQVDLVTGTGTGARAQPRDHRGRPPFRLLLDLLERFLTDVDR